MGSESSLFWMQKAADQGLAMSQNNMGILYENGHGVDVSISS